MFLAARYFHRRLFHGGHQIEWGEPADRGGGSIGFRVQGWVGVFGPFGPDRMRFPALEIYGVVRYRAIRNPQIVEDGRLCHFPDAFSFRLLPSSPGNSIRRPAWCASVARLVRMSG